MATNTNATKIKDYNAKRQDLQNPTDSVSKTPAEKIQADTLKRNQQVSDTRNTIETNVDKNKVKADKADTQSDENEDNNSQEVNDSIRLLTDSTAHLIDQVNARVNPVKTWIASQPTPGGIAAILIFIAFMMLAIIPVNAQGQTRLYLFYNTLVGRTHMKYREDMTVGAFNTKNTGGGSSGSFGTTPTVSTNGSTNGTIATGQPVDLSLLNLFGSTEA